MGQGVGHAAVELLPLVGGELPIDQFPELGVEEAAAVGIVGEKFLCNGPLPQHQQYFAEPPGIHAHELLKGLDRYAAGGKAQQVSQLQGILGQAPEPIQKIFVEALHGGPHIPRPLVGLHQVRQ